MYHPDTSPNGCFASPDNCAIDSQGRIWAKTKTADGPYVAETDGALRGYSPMFLRTPVGAEL